MPAACLEKSKLSVCQALAAVVVASVSTLLVPSVALRFAPAAVRAKEKAASAGHPRTTVENVAPTSARVWILQGTSPVPRDVVIVGSDGERTAITGVVEGDVVVVAEGGRP